MGMARFSREHSPSMVASSRGNKTTATLLDLFTILSLLSILGCTDTAPKLGRDLPRSWSDQTPYFDERVKERFPIGSSESTMISELRSERFSVRDAAGLDGSYNFAAVYEQAGIPCREAWTVLWSANGGVISQIHGRYRQVCL
jgi:hypothetical protein